jgi:Fe-S-cluster containining protein
MKPCNQCGKCCIAYSDGGLSATQQDIEGWETYNPEIAKYVVNGQIWMDPKTGERLTRCPWLEPMTPVAGYGNRVLYGCGIYEDRPEDCRHYPTSIAEMQRDGCEMLELQDLDAPKAAQATLDQMMADSRLPYSS